MPCWRWRKTPTSEEYLADPVDFWVVELLDLAYVVPIVIGVGIGLLGLTMHASDAPGASAGLAAGSTIAAAVALGLAVAAYRPVLRDQAMTGLELHWLPWGARPSKKPHDLRRAACKVPSTRRRSTSTRSLDPDLQALSRSHPAVLLSHLGALMPVDTVPGAGRETGDLLLVDVHRQDAVVVAVVRRLQEGVVDVVVIAQQNGDHPITVPHGGVPDHVR